MAEAGVETTAPGPSDSVNKVAEEGKAQESTDGKTDPAVDEKALERKTEDTQSAPEEEAEAKTTLSGVHNNETVGNDSKESETPRDSSKSHRSNENRRDNHGFRKRVGNKSDLLSQKESSDPIAIRKQVEFYFSDSNLASDNFLFSKVDGPANNAVPIKVICSFKRMRHFQPFSAVVDALKASTSLEVVEEDKDDPSVRRRTPLSEKYKDKSQREVQKVVEDAAMARTVYVKGFGSEKSSTQFDIEAFFVPHGTTKQVRLRRHEDKTFKGSVFVEFDAEETAKSFLALDPKPKYGGQELLIMSKKQYCDQKVEDIKAGRILPRSNGYNNKKAGSWNKNKTSGADDKRDWRERREEDRKHGFRDNRGRNRDGRGNRGAGKKQYEGKKDGDTKGPQTGLAGMKGSSKSSSTNKDAEKVAEDTSANENAKEIASEAPTDKDADNAAPETQLPPPSPSIAQKGDEVPTESARETTNYEKDELATKKRSRDETQAEAGVAQEGEPPTKKVDVEG